MTNILLNKIIDSEFCQTIPKFISSSSCYNLSFSNNEIIWKPEFQLEGSDKIKLIKKGNNLIIDISLNIPLQINEERIGIGRSPLFNYKFDIKLDRNKVATGMHIGDGSSGFSFGNGTSNGFIPEIIGKGESESDPGLYFLARSSNNIKSDVPLIILDSRDSGDKSISNRPILGITSGDFNNFKLILDEKGRLGIGKLPENYKLELSGKILCDGIIIPNVSEGNKINHNLLDILDPVEYENVFYFKGSNKYINYTSLIPLLVSVIKDQEKRIKKLERRNV